VATLQGYFDLLDDLVKKWNLSAVETRSVFLEVSQALEASGQHEKAQQFLVKYLASFPTEGGASVPPEAKTAAVKGATGAVKFPITSFLERHNVAGLAPVAALKGDKEHGALFGLLEVFANGNLSAYRTFIKVCLTCAFSARACLNAKIYFFLERVPGVPQILCAPSSQV